MTPKKNPQEEAYFQIVRLIEANPQITQRELADRLGVSLGKVNYCVNALVAKGWIKLQNFSNNPRKIGYFYLLTPIGIKEKSELTGKFLSRKINQYELLKAEIDALKIDAETLNMNVKKS